MFNNSELHTLTQLVDYAHSKRPDNSELISIKSKIESLNNLGVPDVPNYSTKDLEDCLKNLEEATKLYTSIDGGSSFEIYEEVKKTMAGNLQYLATYKDKFIDSAIRYEDVLKEQLKSKLMYVLQDEQGISLNQAEKVVKGDYRYTEYQDKVYSLRSFANRLKSGYDVYSKIWQGVIQSVSTSKKEQYTTN